MPMPTSCHSELTSNYKWYLRENSGIVYSREWNFGVSVDMEKMRGVLAREQLDPNTPFYAPSPSQESIFHVYGLNGHIGLCTVMLCLFIHAHTSRLMKQNRPFLSS